MCVPRVVRCARSIASGVMPLYARDRGGRGSYHPLPVPAMQQPAQLFVLAWSFVITAVPVLHGQQSPSTPLSGDLQKLRGPDVRDVTSLDLSGSPATDQDLERLAGMPALRKARVVGYESYGLGPGAS